MGRKDKLRREKQARQRQKENTAPVATATTTIATPAQATPTAATTGAWGAAWNDDMFPTSELYVQAKEDNNASMDFRASMVFRGATEYGCITSMKWINIMYTSPQLNGREIHFGHPWLLEGAIRGSMYGVSSLLTNYRKVKPEPPKALVSYWFKMMNKHRGWSGYTDTNETESFRKLLKDNVVKQCAICFKQDTEILTLRQCMGCSMYCYCSKECQTIHYNEHKHGGECRQLQILNKYHKPYAKEIRKAAIRGESHPALEKLRHKLGLTRPVEEYRHLRDLGTTDDGRPCIDPFEYVTARDDGTVWIGSTPTPIGPFSSDTDTGTGTGAGAGAGAGTTTTTITDVMSMKVGAMKTELKGYGICTGTFIEKSEFVDALQKARNGTSDRKPKST